MQITLVGLPLSGKSTVFNALTHGHARTAAYRTGELNIGVAKLPDPRLDQLAALLRPQRIVHAEVTYVDLPPLAPEGARKSLIEGATMNLVAQADTLMMVVRAFSDPSIPHPEGSVDYRRDIGTLDLELALADLDVVERRQERVQSSLKGAKAHERDALLREQELLAKLRGPLEAGQPLRGRPFTEEETRLLLNFHLLTSKPLLLVLNIGEEQLGQAQEFELQLHQEYGGPFLQAVALCGKLEMELAQLEEQEAQEFRRSLGIDASALDRIVRLSYQLLGLLSFFTYTTASQELRAWTIPKGTTAVKAAGRVHSDMERGFIRAEVVKDQDLLRCGSTAEARKQGLLRAEGKSYLVQDGDVITFLFHV